MPLICILSNIVNPFFFFFNHYIFYYNNIIFLHATLLSVWTMLILAYAIRGTYVYCYT